jgi:hypothetical protein
MAAICSLNKYFQKKKVDTSRQSGGKITSKHKINDLSILCGGVQLSWQPLYYRFQKKNKKKTSYKTGIG